MGKSDLGTGSADSTHHNLLGNWMWRIDSKDDTKVAFLSYRWSKRKMSLTGIWEMEDKKVGSESIKRQQCLVDQKYPLWKFCSEYCLTLPTFI